MEVHTESEGSAGRENESLFDFLEQWHEHRVGDAQLSLADYLARFPDCQEQVAREYLRLASPAEHLPPSDGEAAGRYSQKGEIARGGMGVVHRVRDERLSRDLAMKTVLRAGSSARRRFEKEARITGQLDHPGIPPVHDLGTDESGLPWFTMRLISGRDLREIIGLVHSKSSEWTLPAALNVLLRVCETVAYAHSRGVVHRDLKPANVRVGEFGEVYVLDWGLARAEHEPELDDLRLRANDQGGPATAADSPLHTMDGDVIGTPCAMPPEQAAGKVDLVGPRSDVYSVGAMLYEMLSGCMPYVEPGERPVARRVLDAVIAGPPRPLAELAPSAPVELVAIADKAMAREPAQRYVDMREMATDLRAFLEGRVVRAYRTGLRADLTKWIGRNRRLAWAIVGGLAVVVSLLVTLALDEAENRRRLRLLADARAPADLIARAKDLSTGRPEDVPGLEHWLLEASELVVRHSDYEREFRRLKARALPWNRDAPRERVAMSERQASLAKIERLVAYYRGELERMLASGGSSEEGLDEAAIRERLGLLAKDQERVESAVIERQTWEFRDRADAERFAAIERLLTDIQPLLDFDSGEGLVSLTRRRLALVETLEERSLVAAGSDWQRAIASIADPAASPRYAGLEISPQLGLVPLRQDAASGLWEFVHLPSGEPPAIAPDGALLLDESSGIVLVLLPAARVVLGAQADDPGRPNFDASARPDESAVGPEGPELVHAILAPFFLSKYEVTQAQWRRVAGRNPSHRTAHTASPWVGSERHPVESVDWNRATRQLRAVGLTLPTEAQWEYAARAGTSTPWWTGVEARSLDGAANLVDLSYGRLSGREAGTPPAWRGFDDGFAVHAPVGSLRPNGFGLHDVCGNVSEWCLDAGFIGYDKPEEVLIDTFERSLWGEGLRVRRGGSFDQRAGEARSAARRFNGPDYAAENTGIRPARRVDP